MKRWTLAVVAMVVMAGVATAAAPPSKGPRAKARQHLQHDRIRDGIGDHSLMPGEAARLRAEQLRIHEMAEDFASDGVITPAERAKLEAAQDAASADIARERHDRQGAFGPAPNWHVWDPGVNRRQLNQYLRIIQGIASGELTSSEAAELAVIEAKLVGMAKAMKSDGVLTLEERKRLHAALDAASGAIFALKHDSDARPRLRPFVVTLVDGDKLTRGEAREMLAQMGRMLEILRTLAGPTPLAPERRAGLESEFASLASQLFE